MINYIRVLIAGVLLFLGISNYTLRNKVNSLDEQLTNTESNLKQYQSFLTDARMDNRVLQLSIEDFKNSNDSIVNELSKKTKELKIKDKQLQSVISNDYQINDTLTKVIQSKDLSMFTEVFEYNPLTVIKVSRVDTVLTCIPDIRNHQDLIVYTDEQYRKKGFFRRLFSLNFKKDKINRYKIMNTNPAIKMSNTRVINISK